MPRPKHVPKAAAHVDPAKAAERDVKRMRRAKVGRKPRVVLGTPEGRALGIK